MTLVSFFCFLIASLIALSCLPKGSDLFSPARVFGFIWSIAIGLADLKLSGFQHTWGVFAWITLLLGILSFLSGVFIVQVLCLDKNLYSIDNVRDSIRREVFRDDVLFIIIIMLFICYVSAYVAEWQVYGALPIFSAYPDKARVEIGIFGVHLFVLVFPIILFLIFEYFILARRGLFRRLFLLSLFVTVFFSYFLLLNRFLYVMFFFMAVGFAYYSSRVVKLRYVVGFVAFLLVSLWYIQSFRESRYAENYLYVVSKMRFASTYAALTTPYMYIVMNLENFARAVERLEQHTFGYFSLDALMALIGIKHWIGDYFGIKERVFLNSGYNTFPFFWDYYYDYGLLGLTVLPGLLGSFIALLHKQMRTRPSVRSAAFYSMAIFVMVISFFTNVISSLNFVFALITLVTVQTLLERAAHSEGSPSREGQAISRADTAQGVIDG
ncbi:MAG: O-antigen polymerase [Bacteroidota bacterium]